MLLGALRSALSAKLRDGELKIVRAFELADHKTKNVAAVLGKLEVKNTALLVEAAENTNLTRGSRNLAGIKLVPSKDVTVYDLLKYKQVLLSEAAARKLSEALA
jgi:large subunit ribosomal protein L4